MKHLEKAKQASSESGTSFECRKHLERSWKEAQMSRWSSSELSQTGPQKAATACQRP